MKQYKRHLNLKQLLTLLIGFAIFMMLAVELFYYYNISIVIRGRTEEYTDNLLNQLVYKLDSTLDQIKQSANLLSYHKYTQLLLTENTEGQLFELNKIVSDNMSLIMYSNGNIDNIVFTNPDRRMFCSTVAEYDIMTYMDEKYHVYDRRLEAAGFSGVVKDTGTNKYYYVYMQPIYMALPGNSSKSFIGSCMVFCNTKHLNASLQSISAAKSAFYLILDSENKVLASNDGYAEPVGTTMTDRIESLFQSSNHKAIMDFNGVKSLFQYKIIQSSGWKVISVIPLREINDDMTRIKNRGLAITFIVFVFLVIIGFFFNHSIAKPISALVTFMNNVAGKNIHRRLDIKESNEIGQLTGHINNMLDEIEGYTKKIVSTQSSLYEMELSKKQAELSALQSQINPHFLYNTFDCIRGIGFAYNSKEIVGITSSLTKIFRYSITGSDIVTVREEIDCVKEYLNIISIRFCGKYTYTMDLDEQMPELKVIKFILQPIVENSIYHGLEQKSGNGLLRIRGFLKPNGAMYFEIYDNGRGMTAEAMEALNSKLNSEASSGILSEGYKGRVGLVNINSRIKHFYGADYGIKIFSRLNEGTTVILELPCTENFTK